MGPAPPCALLALAAAMALPAPLLLAPAPQPQPRAEPLLLPHGPGHGDAALQHGDDSRSAALELSRALRFYGAAVRALHVSAGCGGSPAAGSGVLGCSPARWAEKSTRCNAGRLKGWLLESILAELLGKLRTLQCLSGCGCRCAVWLPRAGER